MPKMIVIPPRNENGVTKIRIAAYCRVSSNHADQENSYETQVRYFSNLYNNSETAQLVGIYADDLCLRSKYSARSSHTHIVGAR